MCQPYPDMDSTIDPRYNIPIPSRDGHIDRSNLPLYSNYEELLDNDFPRRKWCIEEIPRKGRGLICTSPIYKGETVMKEKASTLYLGPDTEDNVKDSTYYLIENIYKGNATITPTFAACLAQNTSRNEEFEEHFKSIYNNFIEEQHDFKYGVEYDELRLIVNGIHTNSFALDFQDGFAIFMGCSLANHSCCENMGWHTVGDTMYYTALQDIDVGTELTYYGFTCDCLFCTTGVDIWRIFKCSICNGMIYPDVDGWVCHKCKRTCDEEEIAFFEAEEKAIMRFKKESRYRWLYRPLTKMHYGHLILYKALRNYFMTQACPNPIQIVEEYLLPIAEFHRDITHGRLYAAILEQYAFVLLKYATVMTNISDYCEEKALDCLKKAYDYRCSIGMGVSGYAAAIYLENMQYFDVDKLNATVVHYEEY
ncbi:SET domain-containing protein [Entamoeba marina]